MRLEKIAYCEDDEATPAEASRASYNFYTDAASQEEIEFIALLEKVIEFYNDHHSEGNHFRIVGSTILRRAVLPQAHLQIDHSK